MTSYTNTADAGSPADARRRAGGTVSVIGLGYVGLPLALRLVEAGLDVWGVEHRHAVVDKLRHGVASMHEPGLAAHLVAALRTGRFHVVTDIPPDVAADIYLVCVGTSLDDTGTVSLVGLVKAIEQVAAVARPGSLVVLRSTVAVGTTRTVVRPALDRLTSFPGSVDLAFCPERTLQGRAWAELRTLPQVVAGDTERATARASALFGLVTTSIVEVSSTETAEIVKLAANTYRDVTFAFANETALLCDAAGVSISEVVEAGSAGYPRPTMPRSGPVGGSCLPEDSVILAGAFHSYGLETPAVVDAARRANERVPAQACRAVLAPLGERGMPARPVALG